MGSFSWIHADDESNVVQNEEFKFLIPKEFGGGSIVDRYQDYGYLGTKDDGTPKYDMYELLAFWNECEGLKYNGTDKPKMKEIDDHTDDNRNAGIEIGCYSNQIDELKYPLKLVSVWYDKSYEECEGRSYVDPLQGFCSNDDDYDDDDYDDYND
jgi:hypothetical protein